MTGRVAGRTAFITGAARGLGRAQAVRLAQEGADVVAVDLAVPDDRLEYRTADGADLARTVELVEATGRRILALTADIRDLEALRAAVSRGEEHFGRLDVVVANAGVSYCRTWDETTPEMFRHTMDVNVTGTWNTVMATAPALIRAGGGSIVVMSSTMGLVALPFFGAYSISKFALTGLAKSFAIELGPHGIRVNSVHPTAVETPMGGDLSGTDSVGDLLARQPRFAPAFANMLGVPQIDPDDVAQAVLYLAGDESRFVTGSAMTVDAGQTAY